MSMSLSSKTSGEPYSSWTIAFIAFSSFPHAPHRSGCTYCSEGCEEGATSENSSSKQLDEGLTLSFPPTRPRRDVPAERNRLAASLEGPRAHASPCRALGRGEPRI